MGLQKNPKRPMAQGTWFRAEDVSRCHLMREWCWQVHLTDSVRHRRGVQDHTSSVHGKAQRQSKQQQISFVSQQVLGTLNFSEALLSMHRHSCSLTHPLSRHRGITQQDACPRVSQMTRAIANPRLRGGDAPRSTRPPPTKGVHLPQRLRVGATHQKRGSQAQGLQISQHCAVQQCRRRGVDEGSPDEK